MELITSQGFCVISAEEMFSITGGSVAELWNEVCKAVTVGLSGAIAGAKVGALTCTPVGVVAGIVVGAVVAYAWDALA